MLKPDQLFFLLEVLNYLRERLLQDLYLALEHLNLFLLLFAPLIVLVSCAQVKHHIPLEGLVVLYHTLFLSFVIIKGIPLRHSLLSEFLVLMMNIPLDVLDI